MKQLLQNLGSGETTLADVPTPSVGRNQVLIATQASVVSIGTEKMLIQFGKASLIQKARQQPDRVKDVVNKIKTDGLSATMQAVKSKLDQPVPLGYCNAGVVLAVGSDVRDFRPGDRVVSNGPHAEVVSVPENLCARIPDGVSYEDAAFAVLGAIALQGVRLIEPTLGESVVVTGLGLIGLIAVQLLQANGCRVLGIDFDPHKCAMAEQFGAQSVCLSQGGDPIGAAEQFSRGRGVDAVLITASTQSDEPVHQAALMCRKRGRVVLTGVVGLNLKRDDFYKKEISFQVSCSYGPGRYEEAYEDRGYDYPIGYVRWTSQRNFEAFVDLLESKRVAVQPLITSRVPFDQALEAYGAISPETLGVVLTYPEAAGRESLTVRKVAIGGPAPAAAGKASVVVIGAGNFSSGVLVPAIAATGARLHTIVSNSGVGGTHLAKKHNFGNTSTDAAASIADPDVNTVFITTRHDSHAKYVVEAVRAGKRVFVEKPLAITREELAEVVDAVVAAPNPFVMVGFNRRFSPHVEALKKALQGESRPKNLIYTVNAGAIPMDSWVQNPLVGGGRIIGEGCHFIDTLRFLVGSPIVGVRAISAKDGAGNPIEDEATILLQFADGSTGTVLYLANGSKAFPKERIEVFSGGKVARLDNYRRLEAFGWPGFPALKTRGQEKGHLPEVAAVIRAIEAGGPAPIPFEEIVEVTAATFDAAEQIRG